MRKAGQPNSRVQRAEQNRTERQVWFPGGATPLRRCATCSRGNQATAKAWPRGRRLVASERGAGRQAGRQLFAVRSSHPIPSHPILSKEREKGREHLKFLLRFCCPSRHLCTGGVHSRCLTGRLVTTLLYPAPKSSLDCWQSSVHTLSTLRWSMIDAGG